MSTLARFVWVALTGHALKTIYICKTIQKKKRPFLKKHAEQHKKILDPYWLAGFTTAEGCFIIGINNASDRRTGVQVRLAFDITQHQKDEQLMRSLVEFFGCGAVFFLVLVPRPFRGGERQNTEKLIIVYG